MLTSGMLAAIASLVVAPMLVFVRLFAATLLLPFLERRLIPARVRLSIAMALTFAIAPDMIGKTIETPLLVAVGSEIVIGLLFGFLVSLVTSSARLAGEIVSQEMGLSIASVIDPLSGAQTPVIAQLFELFLLLAFFAVNAHHSVLRALYRSFEAFPLGTTELHLDRFAEVLLVLLSGCFEAALRMALPLFSVLSLITVVVALLSRAVPQVNVLEIGLASRILVGLLLAGATLPGLIRVGLTLISFLEQHLAQLVAT